MWSAQSERSRDSQPQTVHRASKARQPSVRFRVRRRSAVRITQMISNRPCVHFPLHSWGYRDITSRCQHPKTNINHGERPSADC